MKYGRKGIRGGREKGIKEGGKNDIMEGNIRYSETEKVHRGGKVQWKDMGVGTSKGKFSREQCGRGGIF